MCSGQERAKEWFLEGKYPTADVPEACRSCFYFIFNNYGLGMKVAMLETHCTFSVSTCMLTNVSLNTVILRIKAISKSGN